MPSLEWTATIAAPVERVFAQFVRPLASLGLLPPELHLTLVSGPEVLEIGSVTVVQGRRWGLSQKMTMEVTELVPNRRLVEVQRKGPFRQWMVMRLFEPQGEATQLTDRIEFEPPGGVLGLMLSARRIEQEMAAAIAWRNERLQGI